MKKTLKYLAIVIGIILVILIAAPFLFKGKIVDKLKKEVNKQVNAKVDFDNDISLSFLRNFPNASLGVDDLSVIGRGTYDGDTLAYIRRLHVVIDLMSLFKGDTYQIRDVSLDNPFIQLLVDSSGKANWDIMKEDTTVEAKDTSSSSFKAALQQYSIQNGHLIYSDSSIGFLLNAEGLDHSGKGDFTQDVFDLITTSHAKALTIAYGGVPYLSGIETDIDADIKIEGTSKFTFRNSVVKLNGLTLGVGGYVALPDSNDIKMDLSFQADKADFKNFLSLIPAIYQKDFDKLEASGKVAFNGFVKGVYNDNQIPAFGLKLMVENGMFQYPSVPEPLSDVNLSVNVENKDGDLDHTFINVKQLHFRMGSNPFDAHLTVQNPKSNPLIDGAVKGKLNLSEVSKIYPLEKGTELAGLLNMDVKAKGRLNDITNKKYDKFQADGQVTVDNLVYQSTGFEKKVHVPQGKLTFSPQQVKVSDLTANIGKSDISAAGGLDNLFGYLFGKEDLKGYLKINSKLLDLNDMMGADTASSTDSTGGVEAVIIPKNINFDLTTNIGRFIYDNYDLKNVRGNVKVADGVLTINNISTEMLDGSAVLSGTYNTRNPDVPKTSIALKANHIDIQKAFKTFNTVQALAPIAQFVQGNLSGNIDFSTLLNKNLYPKMLSINSLGNIDIPNFNIKGFEPLQELAAKLGMPKLKDLSINKLLLHFEIDSGFLKVKPFDFKVDDIPMNVVGKNGLNKVIDYTIHMDIPREKLGDANKTLSNLVNQANKATSGNIDLGDNIPVNISMGGTITHPKISLDLSEAKKQVDNAIKSEAEQQLKKGANKLLDKIMKTDSTEKDTVEENGGAPAEKQLEDKLKKGLQKGLDGFLNRKKDTGK